MPLTENDLSTVYSGDVLSATGEKIGGVGQVYLDDRSGEPTFVTANTGLFGTKQSFVPLRGARVENGNVVVDFDKTTVKDAPRVDDDGSLSPAEEDELYAYYGMSSGDADTDDYGVAGQTPEAGYAQADRGADRGSDQGWDNRPRSDEGGHAGSDRFDAGDASDRDRDRSAGLGGPDIDERADRLDADDDRSGAGRDEDGAPRSDDDRSGATGGDGRLRKWVMTEYEPVETKEVYTAGAETPDDRSVR